MYTEFIAPKAPLRATGPCKISILICWIEPVRNFGRCWHAYDVSCPHGTSLLGSFVRILDPCNLRTHSLNIPPDVLYGT